MNDLDRNTLVHTGLRSSNITDRVGLQRVVCRVAAGPEQGQQVAVGTAPLVVGADADCDLVLTDDHVSRHHLEIVQIGQSLRVRDLESTNGSFYQGSRITQADLPLGASITLGATTLTLSATPVPRVRPSPRTHFGGLVGESEVMREIFAILRAAAPADATVLLEGASGTGKELAARAIHDHSSRDEQPFVVADCSAISEGLVESHFFGHKKGAFTGAVGQRRGAFVEADGGTLFLDEIGELPLAAQAKLLRALESRTVQPVGSDQQQPVDVRVVAATHRDLQGMVAEGSFRFDLFHRLAVIHLRIPALRERPEDLPALVRNFFEGRDIDPGPIDGDNLDALCSYAWPGNVRELRNALERAWVLADPERRKFRDLDLWTGGGAVEPRPSNVDTDLPFKEAKERVLADFERRYLTEVWGRFDHNTTRAAEHAGVDRKHLRELLQKHSLKRP